MNGAGVRFPYLASPATGFLMPLLPIRLELAGTALATTALLDSGTAVNVLPFSVGQQLGADWDALSVPLQLTGTLANVQARGLLVTGIVANLPPAQLAFAWCQSDALPVLLGQVNFFTEFDVCFFRKAAAFEVRRS